MTGVLGKNAHYLKGLRRLPVVNPEQIHDLRGAGFAGQSCRHAFSLYVLDRALQCGDSAHDTELHRVVASVVRASRDCRRL